MTQDRVFLGNNGHGADKHFILFSLIISLHSIYSTRGRHWGTCNMPGMRYTERALTHSHGSIQQAPGFGVQCPPRMYSHHARAACVRPRHSHISTLLHATGFGICCSPRMHLRHARAARVRPRPSHIPPLCATGSSHYIPCV